MKKVIVFACESNAGRSQMGAAFFDALADTHVAHALSAGTQPAGSVQPEVLTTMREVGIDLSKAQPTLLTDELARGASLLVTMGCGEPCSSVPGLRREDWVLNDPKGCTAEEVRLIRDEIKTRVNALVLREGWQLPLAPQ